MARGRMIDKRVGKSKKLGKISDKAKVLWFMIYPHLDVEGRIAFDDLDDLKVEIIPYFKNWALKKIGDSLNELADIGLIQLYPNDNKIAMEFKKFENFQVGLRKDREARSEISPPGEAPASSGIYRITPALRLSISKRKEGKNKEGEDLDVEFEEFWAFYRSIGNPKDDPGDKQEALKAYKALRKHEKKETIARATHGYADYLKEKRLKDNFPQRKKFASTFLREKRWKSFVDYKFEPSM